VGLGQASTGEQSGVELARAGVRVRTALIRQTATARGAAADRGDDPVS
jgi:hypothetical protein